MGSVRLQNWKGAITYRANSVETVHSSDDIVRIVQDRQRYPSPVRVKGSHHSTTDCVVNEGGTVIDITQMNRILRIDAEAHTITMQAGVLHKDAARALEAQGLQFYVNIELGNMTVGSGACCATKDASYFSGDEMEYGQVASYCIGMKLVQADGSILEVTEEDGELLEMLRSSYGMLGVVFEVTYRVKDLQPLNVEHVSYHIDDFADQLEQLAGTKRSMMMYLFPHIDRVVVEYRTDGSGPVRSGSWQWRVRNWLWKTGSPAMGTILTRLVPTPGLRSELLEAYHRVSQWVITTFLRGQNTSPADQIITYPETAGFAAYTFSIWAFPQETFAETIRAYFRFCQEYFDRTGYRCDLLDVGYHIAEDRQSIFSYTRRGPALTLDPVSTGSEGWDEFLVAYNEFCSQHDGRPLFNQSPDLTREQVHRAFGEEIERFSEYRRLRDPDERFYTDFFRELFD